MGTRPPNTSFLSSFLPAMDLGIRFIATTAFFTGRILSIDGAVADRWGRLVAAAGRPLPAIDSLLAATALEHDLVLVTRNVKDFSGLPVQVFNPWSG